MIKDNLALPRLIKLYKKGDLKCLTDPEVFVMMHGVLGVHKRCECRGIQIFCRRLGYMKFFIIENFFNL